MTLHPRLTRAAVVLVKRFETFQPQAEPTPAGGWSIGYGHTRSAREGARIGEADGEALLIYDLDVAAHAVERALFAPVSQSQFEALTALCFNLGEQAFLRSSALARVNAGAELDAADEIERWRRAELGAGAQVVDALVRRRAAEKAHFLGLPEGEATWPSAQLRPLAAPGGDSGIQGPAACAPPSAALTAANGVQARLRRLIPDKTAPAPSGEFLASEPPGVGESLPADADPGDLAAEPDRPDVVWERTPPPFDPPSEVVPIAPDAGPDVECPAGPPPPATPARPVAPPPGPSAPAAPTRPAPRDPRRPYAVAGGLGVVLFLVAAVMILSARPGLLDLSLGAVGVVLTASGLYGVLGGARTPAPSCPGDPGVGSPDPVAGPFPGDVPDPK